MITIKSEGDFKKTQKFLTKMSEGQVFQALHKYGRVGVAALERATPKDTGMTAKSWGYEVVKKGGTYSIIWSNTHIENGRPIAILLQYGHGTRNGGWVEGRNYINPALQPIFDKILNDVWREVTSA